MLIERLLDCSIGKLYVLEAGFDEAAISRCFLWFNQIALLIFLCLLGWTFPKWTVVVFWCWFELSWFFVVFWAKSSFKADLLSSWWWYWLFWYCVKSFHSEVWSDYYKLLYLQEFGDHRFDL
jgi:hypothetical protein